MAELPRPLPPPTLRDRFAGVGDWRQRFSPGAVPAVVVGAVVATVGLLMFAVVSGGGVGRWTSGGADVALSLPTASDVAAATEPMNGAVSTSTSASVLHVHAAGAVVTPGVVTVPAGARVTDVVAAAGGATPDADLNQVNLAAPVADGERVYVPRQGEVVAAVSASSVSGEGADAIININEADERELEELPGVGPATAKAIVDYRSQHGRFRSVDDLLNVRGIGPAKLSQIKPHARV